MPLIATAVCPDPISNSPCPLTRLPQAIFEASFPGMNECALFGEPHNALAFQNVLLVQLAGNLICVSCFDPVAIALVPTMQLW